MRTGYQRYLFDLIWEAGQEFDMPVPVSGADHDAPRASGPGSASTGRSTRRWRRAWTAMLKFDHDFIGLRGRRARSKAARSASW
ncbi:MAG: hypothetical protein R2713_20780 [Ilumatobacteraceae bacterium]